MRLLPGLVLLLVVAACGTNETRVPADAGADGAADSAGDSTSDVEIDAPVDATADGAPDAEPCGPNPAGCRSTGCPDGEVCFTDFWPGVSCTSSSCTCDPDTGDWMCTRDCEGGACVPAPGAACAADIDCAFGAQWCEDGVCEVCSNDAMTCEIGCEWGMIERNGCHPCVCAPPPPECGPPPATGCNDDSGCAPDEACVPSDATVCLPSACSCDAATGMWVCTGDCATGVCVERVVGVCGEMPSTGCDDVGDCARGEVCEPMSATVCLPTSCVCDEVSGDWICTDDCALGSCQPDPAACDRDDDCDSGAEWCEGGACVPCDNGGLACDLACAEGFEMAERNGCFPCECVRVNACVDDDECEPWQRCEPGPDCLDWCEDGDPTCCRGNTCRDLPD